MINKMKIGGVEVKRRFTPARIVCDAVSLAAALVIVVIGVQHIAMVSSYAAPLGLAVLLVFPVCAVGICAAYLKLTLKSREFKRYKITKQNAQSVYDWWAFSLSLAKVPLLLALFNTEFIFRDLTNFKPADLFNIPIILEILLTVIIMRLARHRLVRLTEVKKVAENDSEVKVKVRVADDDEGGNKK